MAGQVTAAELSSLGNSVVLITGAGGMLGQSFQEALSRHVADARVIVCPRERLDVTNASAVMSLATESPDFIVHCAGDVNADRCERHSTDAWISHRDGTANVVALARATGATMVYPQSVFIFDGHELPVTESTEPRPLSVYGRAKLAAERLVLDHVERSLVVRMAGFFGGDARDKNFVGTFTQQVFRHLRDGSARFFIGERVWQPTYTLDLAENILLLLAHHSTGIYHMGAKGEATFYDVARACVDILGLTGSVDVLPGVPPEGYPPQSAPRPSRMVTANERLDREGFDRQRPWRAALEDYLGRPFFRAQVRERSLSS